MATMTVDCGSFNKTSYNGTTQYGSIINFTIPAGATITGCSVSFTTHAASGSTNDRAFSLNGARAHSGWPTTGMSMNASLLSPGSNTFRVSLKSHTPGGAYGSTSCIWNISGITLSITYTEGGTPEYNPGTVSINKTSLTAGESLTVSVSSASDGVYRNVIIRRPLAGDNLLYVVAQHGSGAGSWTVTIPTSWCETLSPDAPSFELRVYMVATKNNIIIGDGAKMFMVNVPASAVPTIGTFTATRNANGVDASITSYVQNYSKVNLAMGSVAGAMGSTIASYEITGGGLRAFSSSATLGPIAQSGSITFTAVVTDSRGRKATKVVYIDVLSYSAVTVSNVSAYRSDASKNPADEGVFATLLAKIVIGSLDGQNTGEIKGRVYEKGTTPPAWTTMANDTPVLFGGSLSIEKSYTADILVADLITSYQYSIDIPTATVIMGVAADGDGVSFGTYPEAGMVKSAWPIVAPNLYQAYPVGAIYMSYVSTSPATLFGGTWAALGGRMLIGVDDTYTVGSTGGSETHSHGLAAGAAAYYQAVNTGWLYSKQKTVASWTTSIYHNTNVSGNSSSESKTTGAALLGTTDSDSSLPPYLAVYMWRRTA